MRDKMSVLVVGGSTGLGRAMAEELLCRGAAVAVIGRDHDRLRDMVGLGASVIAGDATDAGLIDDAIVALRPSVLILNAGARLPMGAIDTLSFEAFSVIWNTDVRIGLLGVQAALKTPMLPGSRVLIMSSGAAMVLGVPYIPPESLRLSGGYVGAKRMLWFMAHSANAVSRERNLGIHFQVLLPSQLMAGTELGRAVASAYAGLEGIGVEDYLLKRYGPALQPHEVGAQVADILCDPQYRSGVAYALMKDQGPVGVDMG
ncbi:SDR family oxidoreductase [Devosia sp. XK-2]|uniref:SDR family oxidoreductase n=1 Tax=Devosia sp. XK-2 TaxID=3126689 RepID=UPI0030CB3F8C